MLLDRRALVQRWRILALLGTLFLATPSLAVLAPVGELDAYSGRLITSNFAPTSIVGNGNYPVQSACGNSIEVPLRFAGFAPPAINVSDVYWPGPTTSVGWEIRSVFRDFVDDLFHGPYWAQVMTQYIPGPINATFGGSYNLTLRTQPVSSSVDALSIGEELHQQILAGNLPPTAVDGSSMYYVHFAPGVTISDPGLIPGHPIGIGTSCVEWCAYHSYFIDDFQNPSVYFTFAVQPDFTQSPGCLTGCGAGTTALDIATEVFTHELFETATDPYGSGWFNQCVNGEEEVSDLCAPYVFYTPRTTTSSGSNECPSRWAMSAAYSNAAGACVVTSATTDTTCVPEPATGAMLLVGALAIAAAGRRGRPVGSNPDTGRIRTSA